MFVPGSVTAQLWDCGLVALISGPGQWLVQKAPSVGFTPGSSQGTEGPGPGVFHLQMPHLCVGDPASLLCQESPRPPQVR